MNDHNKYIWDEEAEKLATNGSMIEQRNENISKKRNLPNRKAKSLMLEYAENLFTSASPPKKRRRSTALLHGTSLLPNNKYNVILNKYGFEEEDEKEDTNPGYLSSGISLRSKRKLLPHQPTLRAASKISGRQTSCAMDVWQTINALTQTQNSEILKSNINGSLEKNRSRKFNFENVEENSAEKVEGRLTLSDLKKFVVMLKGIEIPDENKVSDGSCHIYGLGSAGNTYDGNFGIYGTPKSSDNSDLVSETNANLDFGRNKKIKGFPGNSSSNKKERFDKVKQVANDHTSITCDSIRNNVLKSTLPTQRAETLESVYRRLHSSELPERLTCREIEFERVCTFIKECIGTDAVSQAMYVSGVPGTGKTATVLQAIRHLKTSKNSSKFTFVLVNAMELADPKQIFAEIYRQLFRPTREIAPKTARKKLNSIFQFRDRKRPPIILVIDELDLLNTKKQEIIYDIFNWSATEESLVSVLAIANTLDLPERLLSQRISSRLGANRLCFQPYDHEEIAQILRDRLRGSPAVESEAVELASRKVAAVSGDLRKALDILRSAAQLAISANLKQLTMKNVQEAIRQASKNARVELIRALSRHSLLLLRAAVAEQLSSGIDEFCFIILFKQYRLQCRVANVDPISASAAYRNAMEMCSTRLFVAAPGSGSLSRRFRLGITVHDVQFAIKQIEESGF